MKPNSAYNTLKLISEITGESIRFTSQQNQWARVCIGKKWAEYRTNRRSTKYHAEQAPTAREYSHLDCAMSRLVEYFGDISAIIAQEEAKQLAAAVPAVQAQKSIAKRL